MHLLKLNETVEQLLSIVGRMPTLSQSLDKLALTTDANGRFGDMPKDHFEFAFAGRPLERDAAEPTILEIEDPLSQFYEEGILDLTPWPRMVWHWVQRMRVASWASLGISRRMMPQEAHSNPKR